MTKKPHRIALTEDAFRRLINGEVVELLTEDPTVHVQIILKDIGMDVILEIATIAYESFLNKQIDKAGKPV